MSHHCLLFCSSLHVLCTAGAVAVFTAVLIASAIGQGGMISTCIYIVMYL